MTLSLHCKQMITEPTHIDGRVLDLVRADVYNVVEVQVGSTVRTSDPSAVFIDVFREQPNPHLVCRQEVYLKNSMNWELVRGDVKGIN